MSLIKTKLSVQDLYELEAEINGVVNQQTGERVVTGLVQQDLSMKTKYWLTRLGDKVTSIKKTVDALRQELFEKHGTKDAEGNLNVPYKIPGEETDEAGEPILIDNPAAEAFHKELAELFEQEHEIEHAIFTLEDFTFKASANYRSFYKLIEEPTAA